MRSLKNVRGVWFEELETGELVPAALTTEELADLERRDTEPEPE